MPAAAGTSVPMRLYLALGDSISIDDYTGVRGGGAPAQLARRLGADLVDLTRDGNTTQGVLADLVRAPDAADVVTLTAGLNDGIRTLAAEQGFLLADLERLFHGHGVASDEPWFVQVIEPNLAGATAIADHWYELLNGANDK